MATLINPLGERLVSKGLIRDWQLANALQEQRVSGDFLGQLLIRKGWLTEGGLLETLAEQFGIPYVRLEAEQVDWAVARRFPFSLLTDHHCFPIRMDAESFTVAIANPLDAWAVSELEKAAGYRKVHLVLASAQDIRAAILRYQQHELKALDNPHKEIVP